MSIFDFFRVKKKIPAPWEKYYTKEELEYEIPDVSIYDQVRESALKYPKGKAIVYEGKTIRYQTFLKKIDSAAISFRKMGIKRGDIVSICLPNIPEALIALYALNKLGAIANMLHPLSAEEEIKQALIDTKSIYLVYMDIFYEKIEHIIHDTEVKKVIIVCATDSLNVIMKIGYKIKEFGKHKRVPHNKFFMRWPAFLRKGKFSNMEIVSSFGRDTPAVILHSGGTSGKPKNVVLQNRTFILGAKQTGDIDLRLKPGDCCLAIMPNFHGFGLSVCMHTPFTLGCHTILVPQFDARKFDILFDKTKPTCVLGVPTLFEALSNCTNLPDIDLSYLKYVISGGDVLPKRLEDKINHYLKIHHSKAKVTQGYGLSEALAAVTLAHDDVNKSGSIGIPLAGNHIKIIDPATRKTKPYGETGEIVIHSKALMLGYLNDESETNTALQVHDDGNVWLHTGDLGYMDEDGFIFYQGREKRMIITSGYNVFPSHVEEVIESHPAVLQCTVVGVPHPYKQEVGRAFIVLRDGYHKLFVKSEIKDYCKKHLAKYMIPQDFVFRKKLPRTKLGKVDFQSLQEDFGEDDDEE